MRTSSYVAVALAAAAMGFIGVPQAHAMATTSVAGLRVAAAAVDSSTAAACRCVRGTVVGTEEERVRYRHGHHRVGERVYGTSTNRHMVRGGATSVESRTTTSKTGGKMTQTGEGGKTQGTAQGGTTGGKSQKGMAGGKSQKGMGHAQGGATTTPGGSQSGSQSEQQKQ